VITTPRSALADVLRGFPGVGVPQLSVSPTGVPPTVAPLANGAGALDALTGAAAGGPKKRTPLEQALYDLLFGTGTGGEYASLLGGDTGA